MSEQQHQQEENTSIPWTRRVLISNRSERRRYHGQRVHPTPAQLLAAWLGAFAGIGLLATAVALFPELDLLVIGSFGASAVLLYAAPRAPFAQPRNLIGGHLVSALIGVTCYRYLPDLSMLQEGVAVATAIAAMMLTHTVHPPGGATALIAVIGSEHIHSLGYGYVMPVLAGALVLLVVALVSNNLLEPGSYPDRWD